MRVLLAEDDPRLADSVRRGLRAAGIAVAGTAAEAREQVLFAQRTKPEADTVGGPQGEIQR